jgi:hypothetical protein
MAKVNYIVGGIEFRDKNDYDKVYKPGDKVEGLSDERLKELADGGFIVEEKAKAETAAEKKARQEAEEKAKADEAARLKAEEDAKSKEEKQ